jgi:hypothetical protein
MSLNCTKVILPYVYFVTIFCYKTQDVQRLGKHSTTELHPESYYNFLRRLWKRQIPQNATPLHSGTSIPKRVQKAVRA